MKPKPLLSLNHLTVPVAMLLSCKDEMTGLVRPPREHQGERQRPEEYRLSGYDGLAIHLRNLRLRCTRIRPLRQIAVRQFK
jgi:hypothetical protein